MKDGRIDMKLRYVYYYFDYTYNEWCYDVWLRHDHLDLGINECVFMIPNSVGNWSTDG
jgi:hypothetical protein